MHICDHHIKVYCNIEKENWSKLKLKFIWGQKFIGGDRNGLVPCSVVFSEVSSEV